MMSQALQKPGVGRGIMGVGLVGMHVYLSFLFFNRVTKWLSHAAQFLEAMVG